MLHFLRTGLSWSHQNEYPRDFVCYSGSMKGSVVACTILGLSFRTLTSSAAPEAAGILPSECPADQRKGGTGTCVHVAGAKWSPRETKQDWRAVASSADGSKLIALTSDATYTSSDSGLTWMRRESEHWEMALASSADGAKLIAVTLAAIYTSSDYGKTWMRRLPLHDCRAVASSADGSKLVAVAYNDHIYTSSDSGATWTPHGNSLGWTSVASSADGTKLVAVAFGSPIHTSSNSGVTWIEREARGDWSSVASSADGTRLVAVTDDGSTYKSTDSGITWEEPDWIQLEHGKCHTRGHPSLVASAADGLKLVATSRDGDIYTSVDAALTWSRHGGDHVWVSVASSADGTKLVAVAENDHIYTSSGPTSTPLTSAERSEASGQYNCVSRSELSAESRRSLDSAAAQGDLATVKKIFASASGEDPVRLDCRDALPAAAGNGHLDVVQYLAENCRGSINFGHALVAAINAGHLEEIRYLAGRHVSQDDLQEWDTGFMEHVIEKGWDEAFLPLLRLPIDLDRSLRIAAEHGRLSMIKGLVARGAKDLTGALAAANSDGAVVSYLVEHGAGDLTKALCKQLSERRDRSSPETVDQERLAIARYLVDHGARASGECGDYRGTPLATALGDNDGATRAAVVSFLLDRGARAEPLRFDDLDGLVERGDLAMLKMLTSKGANLHVRNKDGEGLLELADDPAMHAFLRSQGVTTSWGEHWLHTRRSVGEWSSDHRKVLLALAGLVYLGSSIYLREVTYRGRPQDNGFGTANSMLSMGAAGAIGLGYVGALVALSTVHIHGDSYSGAAVAAGAAEAGALIGGVVGLVGGMTAGYFARSFFKRNAVAYYSLPTAAFVVPVIWMLF